MIDHYYAVIMAGGGGTRLWPLSRKDRPKQMLRLVDERTMFQMAVQRLEGLFPPERILVVTVAGQARELQAESPQIPQENYLIEPSPRGTAPVIALAAIALRTIDPQATMAVLTADQYMKDTQYFQSLLRAGYEVAQGGCLVTLGIKPTFAATGYGYVQRGELIQQVLDHPVHRVLKFKEKPDDRQAREMIESGDHDWNSGMFIWQIKTILAEFECSMPDLKKSLEQIGAAWGTPNQQKVLTQVWPEISPQTIDYGVMEKAKDVVVLPADRLGWSDVGSWDSLFEVLKPDEDGNIIFGENHIGLDTSNSLVYVNESKHLIVTIGVNDLIVIDSGDALLICRREQSQKVRNLVSHLKLTDRNEYL